MIQGSIINIDCQNPLVVFIILWSIYFFRLKVDLQKAQSACEQLSEQLMNAEAAKEKFEAEATTSREDAELARKAKEVRIFLHISSSISHIGILF